MIYLIPRILYAICGGTHVPLWTSIAARFSSAGAPICDLSQMRSALILAKHRKNRRHDTLLLTGTETSICNLSGEMVVALENESVARN